MKIGMIGLGKMGANMAQRLISSGHQVVGYSRIASAVLEAAKFGVVSAGSVAEMIDLLPSPKVIWIMVPSGKSTDEAVEEVAPRLQAGDILIDGGNTYYKESVQRAAELSKRGVKFIDVGTSGGVWGLTDGYNLMVGGDRDAADFLRPIFESLAPSPTEGWGYVGKSGAGHFAKMVHNGIEYGMLQAIGEGFEVLESKKEFDFDVQQVAHLWQHGSVIRSWLLQLTEKVLNEEPALEEVEAYVQDTGEGRWMVMEALNLDISTPVITAAMQRRLRSRQDAPFSDKLVASLRNQFGGHEYKIKK
jgi:6-phosphogluconate dehydrogenase